MCLANMLNDRKGHNMTDNFNINCSDSDGNIHTDRQCCCVKTSVRPHFTFQLCWQILIIDW